MYRHLSLLQLADRIARESDCGALHELHDRRKVFCYRGGELLRLAEFVDRLRREDHSRSWCGGDSGIVDRAYDLTIGKFSNLPSAHNERPCHTQRPEGPDCRRYFQAFLEYVGRQGGGEGLTGEIQKEQASARLLQNLVTRHFYLSCLECRRSSQKFARRYLWKVDGHVLALWLPLEVPFRASRMWLEANVGEVDPKRPGERQRIQAIVDELTTRTSIVSLDRENEAQAVAPPSPGGFSSEDDAFVTDLAETVAEGKVRGIQRQRPAIQALGADRLRQLICQVFDDLAAGSYEPVRMAGLFGLSKATMSRFAGSRWSDRPPEALQMSVPDLWRNTAKTLAADDRFMSVVRSVGLAGRIEKVLGKVAVSHPGVGLMMTIPGVGIRTAEAVMAYIDDPARFGSIKAVGCYFGMVPCQDSSAEKNRFGHITHDGPSTVRRLVTEAAWQAVRRSPEIRGFFVRIQKGDPDRKKIAIVATAHYLLRVMLAMLKSGEVWRAGPSSSAAA